MHVRIGHDASVKYPALLLAVALAACGGSSSSSPDAAPPPDASDPTAIGIYLVKPGARALFYDASGNLVDRATSGADGWAYGHAPSGGTVFSLQPPGQSFLVSTFVAVEPGDRLYTQFPGAQVVPPRGPGPLVAPAPVTITIKDLPTFVNGINCSYEVLAGTNVLSAQDGTFVNAPTDPIQFTFTPTATGDGNAVLIPFTPIKGEGAVYYRNAPATIDLAALLPPRTATIARPVNGATSWTVDTTANGPAIGIVLSYDFGSNAGNWVIVLPPDRTSFTPPTLPSDIEALPTIYAAFGANYVGSNDPAGYTAIRTDPAAMDNYVFRLSGELPPPGIYRDTY
jgi:hypothetical protein